MELKEIPTCKLVEKLKGREGVEIVTADMDEKVRILLHEPAIVLVLKD